MQPNNDQNQNYQPTPPQPPQSPPPPQPQPQQQQPPMPQQPDNFNSQPVNQGNQKTSGVNKKIIIIAVVAVALLVLGFFLYRYLFAFPENYRKALLGNGSVTCEFVHIEEDPSFVGHTTTNVIDGDVFEVSKSNYDTFETESYYLKQGSETYGWSDIGDHDETGVTEVSRGPENILLSAKIERAERGRGDFKDFIDDINSNEEFDFSCTSGADESLFKLPENPEFIEAQIEL